MKLILMDKHSIAEKEYLSKALIKFQKEVYPEEKTEPDVDMFVNYHFSVYLIVADDGSYAGFTSFSYNPYYGLRQPTIGNTFLFIEKEHRRSKAMHLVSIQAGRICEDLELPLEHYIVDGSGSEKFVGRLNGKKIYTTYEFDLTEVKRETLRLQSKVKVKE